MSITGLPGQGSVRVGIPIADSTAGNLLALGVMMALFQRHTTGEGRWVHTSLLEAMVFMLDFQASRWLLAHEVAGQAGNDHPTGIPTGVFPTADRPITLAASSPRQWERFCEALGRPEWKVRGDWGSREGAPAIAQPSMLPSPRSRGRSPAFTGRWCWTMRASPAARSTASTRSLPILRCSISASQRRYRIRGWGCRGWWEHPLTCRGSRMVSGFQHRTLASTRRQSWRNLATMYRPLLRFVTRVSSDASPHRADHQRRP